MGQLLSNNRNSNAPSSERKNDAINCILIGAAQSGKNTMIQSLLTQWADQESKNENEYITQQYDMGEFFINEIIAPSAQSLIAKPTYSQQSSINSPFELVHYAYIHLNSEKHIMDDIVHLIIKYNKKIIKSFIFKPINSTKYFNITILNESDYNYIKRYNKLNVFYYKTNVTLPIIYVAAINNEDEALSNSCDFWENVSGDVKERQIWYKSHHSLVHSVLMFTKFDLVGNRDAQQIGKLYSDKYNEVYNRGMEKGKEYSEYDAYRQGQVGFSVQFLKDLLHWSDKENEIIATTITLYWVVQFEKKKVKPVVDMPMLWLHMVNATDHNAVCGVFNDIAAVVQHLETRRALM